MSNEFQEKLQLYKEGKLTQDEITEIESEIDKFIAISDYLNNDEREFLKELKQQMPASNGEENRIDKLLKRRVNLRIIMITAFSAFSALAVFIFIYFSASKITTTWFGLDYKESYVKRETMIQFAQMFQPKYKSYRSGVETSRFAQQNIRVYLENTVGNTKIDEAEISVRYSFGKPVRSGTTVVPPLIFEDFPHFVAHEPDPISGFKVLENAPQGTKAKIFVEFNKALTSQQIKEHFINKINNIDTAPLDITPIAAIGSKFVLANPSYYHFSPVFPYHKNNAKQLEGNSLKQNEYENMDDQAHKESLIGNLNLIKSNLRLLQVMYYEDMFENINIDDMIKHVENNGAEYVGIFISADSKELLNLKDNPLIHCMRVQNLVIW
ncbi:anti sigma factor C-terminal domain-containing protein [Desnuesiella massiliensis]|uniref:anti sigma factor C-terminal domain-containing protein n=1 Tax=Desnuesiella massiliensis TaxID=1650662 RepID=UPI0006E2F635|nr:anti sigma factor C-terminal domain-containing protein [Desnuesiella massiliensis]